MITTESREYFESHQYTSPRLFTSLRRVEENYRTIASALKHATCFYAVKANPHPEILKRLNAIGAYFDVASRGEIEQCLAAGVPATRLSFGSTIKTPDAIAFAYQVGVPLFVFDCLEEARKIAEYAPGAAALCRIDLASQAAKWPLTAKFGCAPDDLLEQLPYLRRLNLTLEGVSFHLGSQLEDVGEWPWALAEAKRIVTRLRTEGIEAPRLNVGGGFPAPYASFTGGLERYCQLVAGALEDAFHDTPVTLMCEPGRAVVADAGVIEARVALKSDRRTHNGAHWLYLDIGVFNGLFEAYSEGIQFRFASDRPSGDPLSPFVISGPTCDSVDVLFEKKPVDLPAGLETGDRIFILDAGAYTTSYATIGFNGFPPLEQIAA
ncbi:MAG: type III PLP-dependent enzyme [Rhodobacteraceae bacterium]|nr:type III PLP-dependent enzyme [Paracoccaceae bacterium]